MPMRLTVRQNLSVFAQLYGVADIAGAHRRARRRSRPHRIPRPPDRQALGRAEDARLAGQGAAQPAGGAAARRADRLARSRHRRLGARAARSLPRDKRRHHPARLAQHERGRAAVRARHHHEAGPHRGRRHAGAPAGALRPRNAGRGVPRRRARPQPCARPRNEHARATPASNFSAQPRRRHGAALLVSAALVLAAHPRPDLLADGADADVGLPADLRRAERRLLRAAPAACSSARCCCGTSCSAASSAFRFRFSRRCRRATSATS